MRPNFTLNYGLRYDYYVPLHGGATTGSSSSTSTPACSIRRTRRFYSSKKNNFQPRVSATFSPSTQDGAARRVRHLRRSRADRGSDSADRGRAHQHDGDERSAERLPARPGAGPPELHQQPEQPRRTSRARTPTSTRSRRRSTSTPASIQQELRCEHGGDGRLRRQPGPQPVPAQHRQPDRSACSRTARPPRRRSASSTS